MSFKKNLFNRSHKPAQVCKVVVSPDTPAKKVSALKYDVVAIERAWEVVEKPIVCPQGRKEVVEV